MAEIILLEAERRKRNRVTGQVVGVLHEIDSGRQHRCTLVDVSLEDVQVEIEGSIDPWSRLHLIFPSLRFKAPVRMLWQGSRYAGLVFVYPPKQMKNAPSKDEAFV